MKLIGIFLLTVMAATALAVLVVGVLWRALGRILIELCGSESRAGFWKVFSCIFIVLSTLVAAMVYPPTGTSRNEPDLIQMFHDALRVFRAGTIGLLSALLLLGLMIVAFVTRSSSGDHDVRPPRVQA